MLANANKFLFFSLLCLSVFLTNCSKKGSLENLDCVGVVLSLNGTVKDVSAAGVSDGSITAIAIGAPGFTYNINGGAFQASGVFNSLASGNYTVTAKSSLGCVVSANFTVNVGDPCFGKTITISLAKLESDKCANTGKITVTATGSAGFMYKLNASGTFQSGNVFSNVAPGNYIVVVKDAAGCEKTATITIGQLANGPQYTAVQNIIQLRCGACHISTTNGGINLGGTCGIVSNKDGIKSSAVDANRMPQGGPALTAAEKKAITDWINAGGLTSN